MVVEDLFAVLAWTYVKHSKTSEINSNQNACSMAGLNNILYKLNTNWMFALYYFIIQFIVVFAVMP